MTRSDRPTRRRRAAVGAGLVALALGVSTVAICPSVPDEPVDFVPLIGAEHPGVRWVSTASLAQQLAGPGPPVLFDVRAREEFRTSHIRGARRVEPGSGPDAVDVPSGRAVVVYCSIGYRSAEFARRLRQDGHTVRNLAGGIFQWANEGRPVVKDGGPAERVHPYDRLWGRLLEPRLRAPLD